MKHFKQFVKDLGNIQMNLPTKTIIGVLLGALLTLNTAFADDIKREGNTFSVSTSASTQKKSSFTETPYAFTSKDGKTRQVFINIKSGRCIVYRQSKSGNTYPEYLPEEVSRIIAKEMNIEYKEK